MIKTNTRKETKVKGKIYDSTEVNTFEFNDYERISSISVIETYEGEMVSYYLKTCTEVSEKAYNYFKKRRGHKNCSFSAMIMVESHEGSKAYKYVSFNRMEINEIPF